MASLVFSGFELRSIGRANSPGTRPARSAASISAGRVSRRDRCGLCRPQKIRIVRDKEGARPLRIIICHGIPNAVARCNDLGRHALIGWEETISGIAAADWLTRAVPAAAFVYRTNSLVNQLSAAKAGIGLALLPCYLGDGEPDLARATRKPVSDLAGELWIVTHADLKNTARVRAFFDLVGDGLARERRLFEGPS
jgi:DNA-binding transcriptional LysR family regulator